MEDAFSILVDILEYAGLDENEITHLLAAFLEEEAFDYVDCMEAMMREEMFKENKHLLS